MKARKQNFNIRKLSGIASANENVWFFNEASADNQSNTAKRKTVRNDRMSISTDDFSRNSLDIPNKETSKKESPFIVDWQM